MFLLSTRRLKDNVDVLAPFLVAHFNCSLSLSVDAFCSVPVVFKAAYITPRLNKAGMDSADTQSYGSISNLSVLCSREDAPATCCSSAPGAPQLSEAAS